ncbi:hypothetical protein H6G45_08215 [Synechocystis sp. FACHB-383]|uniref:hypothetical protein n=1 Tax=unclassified Synechocystis TaxID=2640012 RepID=UPI001681EE84|nr:MULTISPECIES: hypothetical protein [unclassified Synechocystis]MBD2653475.1 hypothetical protein [Synechocystis sp. FACHB-383]MBE9195942.1 hypothetical protein [Synechocystis sp. LEGE 06083]
MNTQITFWAGGVSILSMNLKSITNGSNLHIKCGKGRKILPKDDGKNSRRI